MKRTKRAKKYFAGLLVCVLILSLLTVSGLDSSVASLGTVKAYNGAGTAASPYEIDNGSDFTTLMDGNQSHHQPGGSGVYIKLIGNIQVTSTITIASHSHHLCDIDLNGHTITGPTNGDAAISISSGGMNLLHIRNSNSTAATISGGGISVNEGSMGLSGPINCNISLTSTYGNALASRSYIYKLGSISGSHINVTANQPGTEYPFYPVGAGEDNVTIFEGFSEPVTPTDAACFTVNNNTYDVKYIPSYGGYPTFGMPTQDPRLAVIKKNLAETNDVTLSLQKNSSNTATGEYQVGDSVSASLPGTITYDLVSFYLYSGDMPVYWYDYQNTQNISGLSYTITSQDIGKNLRAVWEMVDLINSPPRYNYYYSYSDLSPVVTAADSTPAPSPSGGSSGGSSSSTQTETTPPAPTNATTTSSGETKVTDAKGEAITNSLVEVKVKDSTGKTVTKQVLTDEDGNIAKNEVVMISQEVSATGKTTKTQEAYLARSDGTICDTPGFTEVEDVIGISRNDLEEAADKVVYVKEDGSLMQSEKFTITTKSGKKVMYAADENCNIIRSGFFNAKKTGVTSKSVKSGATYFAKANGQIITNALFTVKTTKKGKVSVKVNKKGSASPETVIIDDKGLYASLKGASSKTTEAKYYATKSGKLAKNKWVTSGVNKYYCGASGKVTKTKKHVINNT